MIRKKTPLVSIIINCYNGEKYLAQAIDSIYNQTYKNWEIIFWDNASTDKSASIAKSYDSRLKYYYSYLSLLIVLKIIYYFLNLLILVEILQHLQSYLLCFWRLIA